MNLYKTKKVFHNIVKLLSTLSILFLVPLETFAGKSSGTIAVDSSSAGTKSNGTTGTDSSSSGTKSNGSTGTDSTAAGTDSEEEEEEEVF